MLIFLRLQVPMSLPKTIQPVSIVGLAIVSASNLVNSSSEVDEDACDN